MKRRYVKYTIEVLIYSFFIIVLVIIFFLLQQIMTFTSFSIPTDSMQPTLQPGDNILVNKSIMGARIFNI